MLCLESQAQVSYWFSQWQKKGNAKDAQEFFMWPGTNIYFSYASNHVIINGTGTNVVIATATNALYAQYATNWLGSNAFYVLILGSTNAWSTNALYSLWSTNWAGSNDMWITMTNLIYNATNGFVAGGQTNIYATNLIGLLEGTNVTFTTNASGYLSINSAGGGTSTNIPPPGPGVSDNLYAWWKLDDFVGIAYDSWTNQFNGTLGNGPTWVTGHIGPGALQFNAPSATFVVMNTLTNVGFSSGTITWWVYQTNLWNISQVRPMFSQWKSSGNEFSGYVWSDNKWYLGWSVGGLDQRLSFNASDANWPTNTWVHYAFMWYPTGSSFFTNAVLCASSPIAVTVPANLNSNFFLGTLKTGSPYYFSGILDDVRIYNTNLTISQLQTIYNYSGGADFYVLKSGDTMTGSLSINGSPGIPGFQVFSSGGETLFQTGETNVAVTNLVINGDVGTGYGLVLSSPWVASLGGRMLVRSVTSGAVEVANGIATDMFDNLYTADITVQGTLYANYGFIDLNFGGGGKYAGSTNGIFFGDGSGLTNVPTVGLTITQHITDFILGSITNVYSNGLLVATGSYVVPPAAALQGAGGDNMLGAYGESLEPAG